MAFGFPTSAAIRALGKSLGLPGVCSAVVLSLGLHSSIASEYRLRAGDVIEVSVAGLPQFGQRAPVQLDGSITIPVIGTFEVEGATMADVRSRIQSDFTSRLLTLYGSDGTEMTRTVEREDVSAAIVQYAPIWVSGDVVQSGERAFQPRMTVRQALASAGGLRPLMASADASRYDPISLQGDYIATWLALARHAARAWRFRTELGEARDFDKTAIPPAPVPEDALARILAIEKKIRHLRQVDFDRERKHLERAIALAEEQISSLSERLEIETQGELDDTQDYKRSRELLEQGKLTMVRVVEARRALLYSSTRRLQTASELMQVRTRLGETRRSVEKLEDQRRLAIHEELQAAETKLTQERARLQSLQAKLDLAGIAVPRAAGQTANPQITIIRRVGDKSVAFEAGLDDEVEPGDVVNVELRQGHMSTSANLGAEGGDRSHYAQREK